MRYLLLITVASTIGCSQNVGGPGGAAGAISRGSPEEAAVLSLVNDPQVSQVILDDAVGLDRRAAENLIAHRDGLDGVPGTADDDLFDDIEELDAIPFVGDSALERLLAYALTHGYGPSDVPTPADGDQAVLALVNDPTVTQDELDGPAGLDRRAAENIIAWRNGEDGEAGTADDRIFRSIEELDAIPYVGNSALDALRQYAIARGYGSAGNTPATVDVIFSPQPYESSHNVRVASLIANARHSVDVAMYSFSDERIFDAIEAAVTRGVKVRFVFETANQDRTLTGSAFTNSRSGRLEQLGVNVRYVNKIMHHKFVIIDGPRDDLARADTAILCTGSGNWSYGAATRYDENTLVLQGQARLNLLFQREFNHLWKNSRDFVHDDSLTYELSSLEITDETIEAAGTDESGVYFTSNNFSVSNRTFRIVTGRDAVSDALVQAIENATESILIASGHLRSRPVAEALLARHAADPGLDIRIYLDGQEYIGYSYHDQQVAEREECLSEAGENASKIRACNDRGFYFGYQLGEAGVDVRYKLYAFRWDYHYAEQMHHKVLIIDGDELWTGSYNLSDNAEHNTFENMIVLRGARYASLVQEYVSEFEKLWETGRDGRYEELLVDVNQARVIPLVFDSMALDHGEVTELKSAITRNCPDVWSEEYRENPEDHTICPRE